MNRALRLFAALGLVACLNSHAATVVAPYETGTPVLPTWTKVFGHDQSTPFADPYFAWISGVAGGSGNAVADRVMGNRGERAASPAVSAGAVPIIAEMGELSTEHDRPALVIPIPEPASWLMVLAGIAMLGLVAWRRSMFR
ncbi:MAG: PEP-CTERM sorting domain-containing protein [Burkholderiales bacterium]